MKSIITEVKLMICCSFLLMYGCQQKSDQFDGILGLRWGMKLEQAMSQLQGMGLYKWQQTDETSVKCSQPVSWNGVLYDSVFLYYSISNKQNKYIRSISLLKHYDDEQQAETEKMYIVESLRQKYGSETVRSGYMGNENAYSVSDGKYIRISIYVEHTNTYLGSYLVLLYSDGLKSDEIIERENSEQ